MTGKEQLKKKIEELLDVPPKALRGDENRDIERKLGDFLVERGYIKGIEKREEDWGFMYHSVTRKISVSEKEMPHMKWEQCIFKAGSNEETKEDLFPSPGPETEKYRLLHEANHAYQEYLCCRESPDDAKEWYQKVLEGEIESPYGRLFRFCFRKRMEEEEKEGSKKMTEKGLSVWGNAPNYNYKEEGALNKESEVAVRAQEDANELATMFLWHPRYFSVYLDYLSLNHNNHQIREREVTKEDLEKRGLIQITKEEAEYLKEMISAYVTEMKKNINLAD